MKENTKNTWKKVAIPVSAGLVLGSSAVAIMAEEADVTPQEIAIEETTVLDESQPSAELESYGGEEVQKEVDPTLEVAVPNEEGQTELKEVPENTVAQVEQDKPVAGLKEAETNEVKLSQNIVDPILPGRELNGVGKEDGTSWTGTSYYDFMNYYSDVKQVEAVMASAPDTTFIDAQGKQVTKEYIEDMLDLLEKINAFSPEANIQYDWDSVYNSGAFDAETWRGGLDVVATGQKGAQLKFHIDSHGWWGYELVGDPMIQKVLPEEVVQNIKENIKAQLPTNDERAVDQRVNNELTNKYSNFFTIDMGGKQDGSWYMLKDTDLQNPMLYVSQDQSEAMIIDLDFYGENILASRLKQLIGDQCKKLIVLFTHNHPDHVNNLELIMNDPYLRSITTIYWPEGEPNPGKKFEGQELLDVYHDILHEMKDQEEFTLGGIQFKFNQILNEHTPAGGQVADLTNKILYSGDTLGAQVHLGGTTITLSSLPSWIDGAQKTVDFIKESELQYIIGGHTAYANTPEFADWLKEACLYAQEQLRSNPRWSGLVIVENGKVVTPQRMGEMMSKGLSDREEMNVLSVNFRNDLKIEVEADRDAAIDQIKVTRVDAKGNDRSNPLTQTLKDRIEKAPVTATIQGRQMTIDAPIYNVDLRAEALNGVGKEDGSSWTGNSYYKFLQYYADVLQAKQLMDANPGLQVVDANKQKLTIDYVNDLLDLLDRINTFSKEADLHYDWDSVYNSAHFDSEPWRGGTDVVATGNNGAQLKFHIDSHGWWGYELVGDSIMTDIMDAIDDQGNPLPGNKKEQDHILATYYGNFFTIKMNKEGDETGDWYMLRNADLQNPMLYVSKDGKEALMIDVDFYGANVLPDLIKQLLGIQGQRTRALLPQVEKLNIFFTHMHGDHVNNLPFLLADKDLYKIIHIYWPEGEPETTDRNGNSLIPNDPAKVTQLKDGDTIQLGDLKFQFNQIKDEHTPAGGQLADLDHKILYAGDTLGAQIHLGGTTVNVHKLQSWIDGAKKTIDFIKDNDMEYIIGGHTPYLNTPEFANWLLEACEYAKAQLAKDPNWKGLVIVENGKVVTPERMGEMMKNGLSDREELNVLSVNFINPAMPEPTPQPEPSEDEQEAPEQKDEKQEAVAVVTEMKKTSPNTSVAARSSMRASAGIVSTILAGLAFALRKKEER